MQVGQDRSTVIQQALLSVPQRHGWRTEAALLCAINAQRPAALLEITAQELALFKRRVMSGPMEQTWTTTYNYVRERQGGGGEDVQMWRRGPGEFKAAWLSIAQKYRAHHAAIDRVRNGGTVDPPGWRSPEIEAVSAAEAKGDGDAKGEGGAQPASGAARGAAAAAAAPSPPLSAAETRPMAKSCPKVLQFVRTVQTLAQIQAGTYRFDTAKYLVMSLEEQNDHLNRAEPKKGARGGAAGVGGASAGGAAGSAAASAAAASNAGGRGRDTGEAMEVEDDSARGAGGGGATAGVGVAGKRRAEEPADDAQPKRPAPSDGMAIE